MGATSRRIGLERPLAARVVMGERGERGLPAALRRVPVGVRGVRVGDAWRLGSFSLFSIVQAGEEKLFFSGETPNLRDIKV